MEEALDGVVLTLLLGLVALTFRNANEDAVTIRLISARPATKHEIRQYEQG
ncbi:hypothetical protein [Marinobacter sp. SS8-8]|uniref:hypothetical protein n=1 Tax=Marinobacter sp. SS8-8 TaxID=3050452 RepID=UPI0026DF1574|nr:hypothetical protein [Marinobacter sp. SS8-8]